LGVTSRDLRTEKKMSQDMLGGKAKMTEYLIEKAARVRDPRGNRAWE